MPILQGGFDKETFSFYAGTDKSPWFGKEFRDALGRTWRLVAQNDLCIGYWVKVVSGRPQKTQYAADHWAPADFWD